MWFDGSSIELVVGAGVVIESLDEEKTYVSIQFDFTL